MQPLQSDDIYFECYKTPQSSPIHKHHKSPRKKTIPQNIDVPEYNECFTKDKATDEILLDGSSLIRENGYSATNNRSLAGSMDVEEMYRQPADTDFRQCMIDKIQKDIEEISQIFSTASGGYATGDYTIGPFETSYGNMIYSERQARDIVSDSQYYN